MPTVSAGGYIRNKLGEQRGLGISTRGKRESNRQCLPETRSISPENADSSRTVALWLARNSALRACGTNILQNDFAFRQQNLFFRKNAPCPSFLIDEARAQQNASYARTQFKKSFAASRASSGKRPEKRGIEFEGAQSAVNQAHCKAPGAL